MREDELAEFRLEREAMHPGADRDDQHGGGTVDRVAGADLACARLQEVFDRRASTPGLAARNIEKMLPTDTFTSILEEPSSGSKTSR